MLAAGFSFLYPWWRSPRNANELSSPAVNGKWNSGCQVQHFVRNIFIILRQATGSFADSVLVQISLVTSVPHSAYLQYLAVFHKPASNYWFRLNKARIGWSRRFNAVPDHFYTATHTFRIRRSKAQLLG